jgi:four helix bundle protein
MNAKALALQARTQAFYQNVIKLAQRLPKNLVTDRIAPQLLDSAGSTDSNYRSACRGRTTREFIAKVGIAAEEADEAKGWLESLVNAGIGDAATTKQLVQEADELVAIFTKSEKTARQNLAAREARQKRATRRK